MPATMTLKNIPDDIYARLKEAAAAHHRSLNSEVIACLERTLVPTRVPAQERLARARRLRQDMEPGEFSAAGIDAAIDEGRP